VEFSNGTTLINMTNLLEKTKCYLVGPIEFQDGRKWRKDCSIWLKEMDVQVLDPYECPFLFAPSEAPDEHVKLKEKLKNGDYETVHNHMKQIVRYDLACVDKSDFIIAYIDPNVPTFGSMNELVLARSLRKPVFIVVNGGIEKAPLWLLGMFYPRYFYSSFREVRKMLTDIHKGVTLPDSNRWRLLKNHLR